MIRPAPLTYSQPLAQSEEDQARLRAELGETGFAPFCGTITGAPLDFLYQESVRQFTTAHLAIGNELLQYRSRLASLGPIGEGFLLSEPLGSLLYSAFGQRYRLSPQSSCYTYYREGDFLAAHRDDADGCSVTVLVYLVAESPHPELPESGLYLDIFQDDNDRPGNRLCRIQTMAGGVVIGRGSQVWHARNPLLRQERVDLLAACFTPAV
ncbi:hypothetical protein [Marinobacterium aestuariivivens]|uniref:Fe2OG dioxygenase domain-containing protein n=1 Tax=Marinobacterium aestuariivivens TaxID=1698799 RepID=A0ABW2A0P7_9GAMM